MPDWMIAPAYGPGLQFERIAINQGALCIECKACGRRHSANTVGQSFELRSRLLCACGAIGRGVVFRAR
jgi:hypothetical protein